MAYLGSEAYSLDAAERRRTEHEARRASFGVVEGGGLDAQARRGVSSQFMTNVMRVIAVAAVILTLGTIRVAFSVMTVSNLTANETLRSQISDAREAGNTLRVERAVVASTGRVSRIATQNLGMVKGTVGGSIVLSSIDGTDAASADAAQTVSEDDSAAALS